MNEQELLLKQILNEIQTVKTNMATKQDAEYIYVQLNKLNEKIDAQHIENINADNRLLNEVRTLQEGVIFVNRKVADAELEINLIKQKKQ